MTRMTAEYQAKIRELAAQISIDTCFAAGFDAGKNGIDLFNTDFRYFMTDDRREWWDRGNKLGKEEAGK